MRKIILSSAVAAIAAFAFSPAMADEVVITHHRTSGTYYHPEHMHSNEAVIDRHSMHVRHASDRCDTKTIIRHNANGDRVTKTIRQCD